MKTTLRNRRSSAFETRFRFPKRIRGVVFCALFSQVVTPALQALDWTNSASTFAWNLIDANWSGAVWTNNSNAAFGASGFGTITASSSAVVNDITFYKSGFDIAGTLTLADDGQSAINTNGFDATISAILSNGAGGATVLNKTGAGTLTLSGSNTYTSATIVGGGTLSVSSLANGGVASNIGASSNGDFALQLKSGATLLYTGAGSTTNRSMMIDYAGTIDASGSGALVFSSTGGLISTNTGAAANTSRTITLTGANTGNNTIALKIGNPTGTGSPTTSLSKTGAGLWILSGANTYTGATTISAGTFQVDGTHAAGNGAYSITGATLAGSGNIASSAGFVFGSSGVLTPGAAGAGNIGTLTLDGAVTASAATTFNFDIGGAGNTYDILRLASLNANNITLNLIDKGAYTWVLGDTLHLFETTSGANTSITGTFTAINNLPTLSGGLSWDTSSLYTDGFITVVTSSIPEASTYAAIFGSLALAGAAIHRRRRS
ncbi:MAG: autotransporter-associated beta strand repeat-containing protein [Opitutaceae bacterium]